MDAVTTPPQTRSASDSARAATSVRDWAETLFEPISILPLVYLRVILAGVMLWELWRYATYDWIYAYYIAPIFHFKYFGFEWLNPLPGDGMYWWFALLAVLAAMVLVGLFYRIAAALFFLGFSYVYLLEQSVYLNHLYLVCLLWFLMITIPAGAAWSIDARRTTGSWRGRISAPAWTLWLFRAQIGLVYFFAGVAKLNGDWLRGEPMRMWLAERTQFPIIGPLLTEEWMVYAFSYGGLLLDLLAFPLLIFPRTRPFITLALVAFHLTNYQLFNIGIFPWLMLATLPLFYPWPLRSGTVAASSPSIASRHYQRAVGGFLGVYFAFQVLMPLRHFLYPGDVNWTEEGHRFAWHMKLRDKASTIEFTVQLPNGFRQPVDLGLYLLDYQSEDMAGNPEMIIQFAHYLEAVYAEAGFGDVGVYAWALTSLNGRPYGILINPSVDLTTRQRSLWAADWIIPLDETTWVSDPDAG
jgi:hypothetical protein